MLRGTPRSAGCRIERIDPSLPKLPINSALLKVRQSAAGSQRNPKGIHQRPCVTTALEPTHHAAPNTSHLPWLVSIAPLRVVVPLGVLLCVGLRTSSVPFRLNSELCIVFAGTLGSRKIDVGLKLEVRYTSPLRIAEILRHR